VVFGISGLELVILAVLALLVFGPDKLPGVAQDAGRMVRQLRKMAQEAREEVSGAFPEFSDLGLDGISDLDPRQFVRKQLLEEKDDLDAAMDGKPGTAARRAPQPLPPEALTPASDQASSTAGVASTEVGSPPAPDLDPAAPSAASPAPGSPTPVSPAPWDADAT
jgi:sec-independent protein translocase protein TatB